MASQLKSGYPLSLVPSSLTDRGMAGDLRQRQPGQMPTISILRVEPCELRAVKQHDVALPISDKVEDALAVKQR